VTGDGRPDADKRPEEPDAGLTVDLPTEVSRAASERRCRVPVPRHADLADLIADASPGVELRFRSCCGPTPAPPSVVTCIRRVLEVALLALRPPVSRGIDVHLCQFDCQLGLQVTAHDRRSFGRLRAADGRQSDMVEISNWLRAFSPLYSLKSLERGRANIAVIIPFDPKASWALPNSGHLRFGKSRPSDPAWCRTAW
jgi:hypothetical protein